MESIGPQAPPAPVPSRRSIVPLILLGGMACGLIVVGLLLYQFLNRPDNADDVARDFAVAAYEQDVARACELGAPSLMDPLLKDADAADCDELAEVTRITEGREASAVEVLESTQQGERATVRLSSPSGTPGTWVQVELERTDDRWLVTDYSG